MSIRADPEPTKQTTQDDQAITESSALLCKPEVIHGSRVTIRWMEQEQGCNESEPISLGLGIALSFKNAR